MPRNTRNSRKSTPFTSPHSPHSPPSLTSRKRKRGSKEPEKTTKCQKLPQVHEIDELVELIFSFVEVAEDEKRGAKFPRENFRNLRLVCKSFYRLITPNIVRPFIWDLTLLHDAGQVNRLPPNLPFVKGAKPVFDTSLLNSDVLRAYVLDLCYRYDEKQELHSLYSNMDRYVKFLCENHVKITKQIPSPFVNRLIVEHFRDENYSHSFVDFVCALIQSKNQDLAINILETKTDIALSDLTSLFESFLEARDIFEPHFVLRFMNTTVFTTNSFDIFTELCYDDDFWDKYWKSFVDFRMFRYFADNVDAPTDIKEKMFSTLLRKLLKYNHIHIILPLMRIKISFSSHPVNFNWLLLNMLRSPKSTNSTIETLLSVTSYDPLITKNVFPVDETLKECFQTCIESAKQKSTNRSDCVFALITNTKFITYMTHPTISTDVKLYFMCEAIIVPLQEQQWLPEYVVRVLECLDKSIVKREGIFDQNTIDLEDFLIEWVHEEVVVDCFLRIFPNVDVFTCVLKLFSIGRLNNANTLIPYIQYINELDARDLELLENAVNELKQDDHYEELATLESFPAARKDLFDIVQTEIIDEGESWEYDTEKHFLKTQKDISPEWLIKIDLRLYRLYESFVFAYDMDGGWTDFTLSELKFNERDVELLFEPHIVDVALSKTRLFIETFYDKRQVRNIGIAHDLMLPLSVSLHAEEEEKVLEGEGVRSELVALEAKIGGTFTKFRDGIKHEKPKGDSIVVTCITRTLERSEKAVNWELRFKRNRLTELKIKL